MYDIRQFRPTLYVLLALGITGFCLASGLGPLWVLSMLALGVHWWGTGKEGKGGIIRPLPAWGAALLALLFGGLTLQRFMADPATALITAGQFLALLQLIKLYQEGSWVRESGSRASGSEQKGSSGQKGSEGVRGENRNYAWLLVLSLLLMVAASISTASLAFGLLLIAYLFMGLYCCLLFHLKSETEIVRAAMVIPDDLVNPAVLRQDERFLPSSMRRLTGLVAAAGLTCAVLTFIFFPRGPGAGILGQLNVRQPQRLTGFSEQVSFESVARITQSREVSAYVKLTINGKPASGTTPLYLRGLTLDRYSGDGRDEDGGGTLAGMQRSPPWQWSREGPSMDARSGTVSGGEMEVLGPAAKDVERARVGGGEKGGGSGAAGEANLAVPELAEIVQDITLKPTGTTVLFGVPGIYAVTFKRDMLVSFSPSDETLRISEAQSGDLEYTVKSRGETGWGRAQFTPSRAVLTASGPDGGGNTDEQRLVTRSLRRAFRSSIDPKIRQFAERPEVSGVGRDGVPLAVKRGRRIRPHALDQEIATNIERYLRSNVFAYTLDLTDTVRQANVDPIVQFLYETKRGHCEYFAGAMVLMCQSLGIDARMATGFRCEEYNTLAGRYVVRQSDAHAWVEVRVDDADTWETFDPTSGNTFSASRNPTLMSRLRRVMDFFEYTWADTVVAYNRERRNEMMSSVERGVSSTASQFQHAVQNWDDFLPNPSNWWISPKLVGGVIVVMLLAGLVAIGVFTWERLRLKRRAARIGLDESMGDSEVRRLARQLRFYDELLLMLESRGMQRPRHLTPMEFTRGLAHLPSETYDTIQRLTRIYYRIRYGRAELTPDYQRRVRETLARLEPTLGAMGRKG